MGPLYHNLLVWWLMSRQPWRNRANKVKKKLDMAATLLHRNVFIIHPRTGEI